MEKSLDAAAAACDCGQGMLLHEREAWLSATEDRVGSRSTA